MNRIEVFEQMLDADPSNTMVMFGLAKEYEKLGQTADVIRVLEDYLSKADDLSLIHISEPTRPY